MSNNLILPKRLNDLLSHMSMEVDDIGCSEAKVFKFTSRSDTYFLKVEPKSNDLETEYRNIVWLQGKLPVPKIIEWVSDKDFDFLLLSEIKGRMLCDEYYLKNPVMAVSVLAKGIKLFQSVDIQNCPMNNCLDVKLKKAAENIRLNKVSTNDWESSSDCFSSPRELFDFLCNNRPKSEDLVFTHGDYCLPNIFGKENELSGFIDIGRADVADMWQDVALCIRSMRYNFRTSEYDSLLLEQLGLPLDKEKLDYYILLDELF